MFKQVHSANILDPLGNSDRSMQAALTYASANKKYVNSFPGTDLNRKGGRLTMQQLTRRQILKFLLHLRLLESHLRMAIITLLSKPFMAVLSHLQLLLLINDPMILSLKQSLRRHHRVKLMRLISRNQVVYSSQCSTALLFSHQ
jgi:hypothetical protein